MWLGGDYWNRTNTLGVKFRCTAIMLNPYVDTVHGTQQKQNRVSYQMELIYGNYIVTHLYDLSRKKAYSQWLICTENTPFMRRMEGNYIVT